MASALDEQLTRGLLGHWGLQSNCLDASGNEFHGTNHGAQFVPQGPPGGEGAARFDGLGAYIAVPHNPSLALADGDFSIAVWLKTDAALDDVIGDILTKYDPATRRGFTLNVKHHAGMTSSTANYRNIEFGIDNDYLSEWQDCGRPGSAVFICSMAVWDGSLYTGTYEYGGDDTGHVYRYDGPGQWFDCGSPDEANSVMALAVHDGTLYAGTAPYNARGSLLPASPNKAPGGCVYRYLGDQQWAECGRLGEANDVYALAVYQGDLYAIPMYSPGVFRLQDEDQWRYCGTPGGQRSMSLAVFNGGLYSTGNGSAGVWRYLGGEEWQDCGKQGDETQTYAMAVYQGRLYAGSWPSGTVWLYEGGTQWTNCGQLGEEKEVMAMAVHNGQMYCGTLPLAQIYRYEADGSWSEVGRIDHTPDVVYRRAWTMASYEGRLFAGALPSGHIHSVQAGCVATVDRGLPAGWRHIAAVKAADRLTVYLDGRPAATSVSLDKSRFNLANESPLQIGFGTHDYLKGALADLRLYDRALSQEELSALSRRP